MLVNMVEKREETFFSCSFVLSGSLQDPGGRKAVSTSMRPVGGVGMILPPNVALEPLKGSHFIPEHLPRSFPKDWDEVETKE